MSPSILSIKHRNFIPIFHFNAAPPLILSSIWQNPYLNFNEKFLLCKFPQKTFYMMCKTKKMNSFCSWSASKSLIKDQFPIFVENRNIQIAHFSIVTSLLNESSHSLAFSFLCCVCVRKSLKFMMRFFLFCSPTKRTTSIMICSTVCHS